MADTRTAARRSARTAAHTTPSTHSTARVRVSVSSHVGPGGLTYSLHVRSADAPHLSVCLEGFGSPGAARRMVDLARFDLAQLAAARCPAGL